MKKNILVVPSLLAFSLVATAPLLGMEIQYKEKQPTSQGKNRKQKRYDNKKKLQKINQLKQQLANEEKKQQLQAQPKKFAYTMQEQQPITEEIIQQKQQEHKSLFQNPLLQDLHNSKLFIQQSKQNNIVEVVINPLYNPETQIRTFQSFDELVSELNSTPTQENLPNNLVISETEVVTLALPERVTNNTNDNQSNSLLASVILPTQEKTLSWSEKFNYYTSTANQILQQVMDDLETGAFDVRYKTSFDILEEAIKTATKNNDIQALVKIAALCQQKYDLWIRISDAVAQPASELLRTHYSTELTLANNTLEQKLKNRTKEWNLATVACMTSLVNTIATYQENMRKLQEDYNTTLEHENKRITDLRRDVSTFACLNKTIRPATAELLTNNQLKTPKSDVHSSILSASERKLNDVMESVKIIQSIKGFQLKPEHAEELNQKCLTDK